MIVSQMRLLETWSYVAGIAGAIIAAVVAIGEGIKYFSCKKYKKGERFGEETRNEEKM